MKEKPTKGYLRNYNLPSLLMYLNRHRLNGALSVTSQGITKKIYLKKGNAVFASSNYDDDRLGDMLVKAGKITFEQYDEAVELMKKSGKRLGAALVELGSLVPKDLFWGVKYQVQEIIFSVFQFKDGLYEFGEGEIPSEIITLDLSMANIVFQGVKRIQDLSRIKSELPEPNTVVKFSDDPMNLFQEVQLSDDDKKILSLINSERSMATIIKDSGLNSFEASKIVYVLWSIGMITEPFGDEMVSLTVDDILQPAEKKQEDEFILRVNAMHASIKDADHYKLLSVEPSSDMEEINKQYYKRTKEFHPDRYSGTLDPTVKDKLMEIFDAVTAAYEALKQSQTERQFTVGDLQLAHEMLISGKAELKAGNFIAAADLLSEAVNADPDCAECWNYYSFALTKVPGMMKDAEEAMVKALELSPGNSDYHANMGLIYLKLERLEEAREKFEKALSLDISNAKAQKGLSRVFAL